MRSGRREGSKGDLCDAVFNFRINRRKQRKLASQRAPLLGAGPVFFSGGYGLQ